MEPSLPPPIPEAEQPVSRSLASRLFNIFATPGEVFDEVRAAPVATGNWLAPVLLSCLAGIIYTFVIFSQETVLYQVRKQQEQAMEKKLAKLPEAEREKIKDMMEKYTTPTLMKISGSVMAVLFSFSWLFLLATVVWFVGTKALKGHFAFMKAVEICGLAGMIGVLAAFIAMLLVVVTGNMLMTPGPALLIREFDAGNKLHVALTSVNLMTFWQIGVVAVGLGKLSGVPALKAFGWLFALWAAFRTAMILLGFAAQGM